MQIDDQLLATVMQRYELTSKSQAANLALRSLVQGVVPMTRPEVLAMEGSGFIDEDPSEVIHQARNQLN